MKIFFDTKDLIELIEKSIPISTNDLEIIFREKDFKIVISNTLILELAEPLLHKSDKTNVMNNINQLETIPHIFINTKSLIRFELLEALDAYNNNREYRNIDPFVSKFTDALEINKIFPLETLIINPSLAEIVWIFLARELWKVLTNTQKNGEIPF